MSNHFEDYIEEIPKHIIEKCKVKKVEKDKILILKGNEIEDVYISLKGQMRARNEFENGFVYDFANVESIAYIGVMELMANKQTYSSTLQTVTECVILQMPKQDFIDWINKDHRLTLDVLRFISNNMYEQSLKTGEVLAYSAMHILINYLINVFKSQENKDEVLIEKSREEIASILGFSIRTINRNLKELKEETLVSINRKKILITKEQYYKLCEKLESIK